MRPAIVEYFQTGQMPLAEFLDWQIDGVESAWSLLGGEGPDTQQRAARIDRLTTKLRTSGYTGSSTIASCSRRTRSVTSSCRSR